MGTDQYCIERLLRVGQSDKCTIFSAWKGYAGFPIKVRAMVRQFREYGGAILWGPVGGKEHPGLVKMALLSRNERLVEACYGLVAFVTRESRGSLFTIRKVVQAHKPLVVFPVDCDLPLLKTVKWVPLRCGGLWEGGFKAVYLR